VRNKERGKRNLSEKLGSQRLQDRMTDRQDRHGAELARVRVLPCLWANLRRATRLVGRLYESEPGWPSLSVAQVALLMAIAACGTISHAHLGSLLGLDQTTVSRSLATLRRRRLVRTARGDDGRERRVTLTEAGKLQFQRADRAWRRAQAVFQRRYGADKWEEMQRGLTAIAAAVPKTVRTSPWGPRR
jgi:DNA-binding MarR family transcriptional regulator